jgi:hypothetical protein
VTEKNADLLKLMAMRGNGMGGLIGGGPQSKAQNRPNANGYPIPEAAKETLGRFDKNNDGRLSADEIEAMPERPRERVKSFIRDRMGNN